MMKNSHVTQVVLFFISGENQVYKPHPNPPQRGGRVRFLFIYINFRQPILPSPLGRGRGWGVTQVVLFFYQVKIRFIVSQISSLPRLCPFGFLGNKCLTANLPH